MQTVRHVFEEEQCVHYSDNSRRIGSALRELENSLCEWLVGKPLKANTDYILRIELLEVEKEKIENGKTDS